ncbi:Uncharacterized protein Rs2_15414 [Raphanus sativus]|nr:Uncharacterized protein Rs2_15414 [Raphanus sativus]
MKKKKPKKSPAKPPTKSSRTKAAPSATKSDSSDLATVSDAPIDGSAAKVAQQICDSSDLNPITDNSSPKETEITVVTVDPSPASDEVNTPNLELSPAGEPQSTSVSVLDVLAISVDELDAVGSLPLVNAVVQAGEKSPETVHLSAAAEALDKASADAKIAISSSQEDTAVAASGGSHSSVPISVLARTEKEGTSASGCNKSVQVTSANGVEKAPPPVDARSILKRQRMIGVPMLKGLASGCLRKERHLHSQREKLV